MFLHPYVFAQLVCIVSLVEMNTAAKMKPVDILVKNYGYPFESHTIHTSDGYILTYHRVPHGKNADEKINRQPVLLSHGVLESSRAFLAKKKSLPYLLADAGFDVWLANYRGNFYSRQHETLDPVTDDRLFWNFTLTEFGLFDFPAAIDYILIETSHHRLSYIGVSMGNTVFWILGAMRPEYMPKVSLMVAIGPVARLANMALLNNSVKRRIIFNDLAILQFMGYHEVMLYNDFIWNEANTICNKQTFKLIMCRMVAGFLNIYIKGIDAKGIYKALDGSPPSSTSTKVLVHYVQIAQARRFQMFDYGKNGNMVRYKAKVPPTYDLKRVTCPVYLIYSKKDDIATLKDVKWLMKQLPNKPTRLLDHLDIFTHAGFEVNNHVQNLMNKPLTEFMQETLIKHKKV